MVVYLCNDGFSASHVCKLLKYVANINTDRFISRETNTNTNMIISRLAEKTTTQEFLQGTIPAHLIIPISLQYSKPSKKV